MHVGLGGAPAIPGMPGMPVSLPSGNKSWPLVSNCRSWMAISIS